MNNVSADIFLNENTVNFSRMSGVSISLSNELKNAIKTNGPETPNGPEKNPKLPLPLGACGPLSNTPIPGPTTKVLR